MKRSKIAFTALLASIFGLASCDFSLDSLKFWEKKKEEETPQKQEEEGGKSEEEGGNTTPSTAEFSFSFSEVVAMFAEEGITVSIPNFEGSKDIEEEHEGSAYYFDNATREEMEAFADSLTKAGWALSQDEYEDYAGYYGQTRAWVSVQDWIDWGEYIRVTFGFDPEPVAEFPYTDLNAFLAEYELGFTIESSIVFPGSPYTIYTGTDSLLGVYHYYTFEVEGDYLDDMNSILEPIITAVGYSLNTEDSDETSYYYSNEAEHEVQIEAYNGKTSVTFFE